MSLLDRVEILTPMKGRHVLANTRSFVPLHQFLAGIDEGSVSPRQALEVFLDRIDEAEPEVRAWVGVDAGRARDEADRLGAMGVEGLLRGLPIGVKDLIDVAGLPTGCGSDLRRGRVASRDADSVRALRDQGAVVMGKTVTTEFGYFAAGPTRNPWNTECTPGGSSSGSAAAVAAGMVPLAIGTQTAGSLTRPASYCGVAGLVTAVGAFSMAGITGLSPSLDSLGLLAPSVPDLHLAWSAMRGLRARGSAEDTTPRILVWGGSNLGEVSDDMSAALARTVSLISRFGGECVDLNFASDVKHLAAAHAVIMAYESVRERADVVREAESVSAPLQRLFLDGAGTSDEAVAAARYEVAARGRRVLGRLADFDAIVGPAALGAAPRGLDATGSPVLSRPWQALGLSAITIPGLFDPHGMPLGIQLIGQQSREEH